VGKSQVCWAWGAGVGGRGVVCVGWGLGEEMGGIEGPASGGCASTKLLTSPSGTPKQAQTGPKPSQNKSPTQKPQAPTQEGAVDARD